MDVYLEEIVLFNERIINIKTKIPYLIYGLKYINTVPQTVPTYVFLMYFHVFYICIDIYFCRKKNGYLGVATTKVRFLCI